MTCMFLNTTHSRTILAKKTLFAKKNTLFEIKISINRSIYNKWDQLQIKTKMIDKNQNMVLSSWMLTQSYFYILIGCARTHGYEIYSSIKFYFWLCSNLEFAPITICVANEIGFLPVHQLPPITEKRCTRKRHSSAQMLRAFICYSYEAFSITKLTNK